jgi:hypothetical protein
MQSNQHMERMTRPWSSAKTLNDRCSGFFCNDMGRAALLAVVFGVVVVLATDCSSTGGGVKAGLIAPVTSAPQDSVPEDDGFYHPPRSPGFNDLTGS